MTAGPGRPSYPRRAAGRRSRLAPGAVEAVSLPVAALAVGGAAVALPLLPLVAVAALPLVATLDTASSTATFTAGYKHAMEICAVVCALGGVIAWLTIRRSTPVTSVPQASVFQPCNDPCLALAEPTGTAG